MNDFDLSSLTILCVDDEGFTRDIVLHLLRSLGCERTFSASNVTTALSILHEHRHVDIVISDFRMPQDNGLKLVKEIRTGNAAISRGTPIAMLTGFAEKSLVEVALALDVNAFLVKPISRNTLGARIRRLLEITADQSWLSAPVIYDRIDIDVKIAPPRYTNKANAGTVDTAPDKVQKVLERLPNLKARFDDTDLADAIIQSVEQLIDVLGEVDATNMVAIFEALERHEIMTMQDIASMLAVPDKKSRTPEISLNNSIYTVDGEILFRAGTRVTRSVAAIIGDLNEVGAISLSVDEILALGLNPANLPPPIKGKSGTASSSYDPSEGLAMKAVQASEIRSGDVLARTVFTSDGRLYGRSGSAVTPRMVDVLKDLSELEKIAPTLWVEQ